MRNEVLAAHGEVVVLGRQGNGSVGEVAVVDAADNRVAGVGERREVRAGQVIGAGSHCHGGGNPTARAGGVLDVIQILARVRRVVVDAVEVRGFGRESGCRGDNRKDKH